jgi:hypothetical protein
VVDDGLVFAGIGEALVDGLADVNPVVEQLVDVALVGQLTLLAADFFGPELSHQFGGRADFDELLENHPRRLGFGSIDD